MVKSKSFTLSPELAALVGKELAVPPKAKISLSEV
jgi:hypothetical protein